MPDLYELKPKRQRYESLRAALWQTRQSGGFDADWRELGDYLLPRRTRFWTGDRNKGGSRNQKILDSTGRFAMRTLASGLHAGLTSPARPWMKLTTPDPKLAEFEPVKEWLHEVTTRMLTVFAQSNLYNALPIVYGDMGTFATAAMGVLEDSVDLFRCYPYPIGSYAVGLDHRGRVGTFAREYELSVRQTVEQFAADMATKTIDWSKCSTVVKNAWDQGNYEQAVPIVQIVKPNDEQNPKALSAQYALPWASCHFEKQGADDRFLRESGYRTFPIMVPRWDVNSPEDSYGTDCPGMTALGDIKQLQIMQREKGKGIAKQVTPPVTGPTTLLNQTVSLLPGGITYADTREGMAGFRSVYDIRIDLSAMTADIRETQYRIQRACYEDLFLMLASQDQSRPSSQPITAREVDERHEEKLLALGPVLERTNDELLNPLIDRVFSLMTTAGLIPDAPDELHNVKLKVEYISILSQAQKLVGVIAQDRFLQSVIPLAQEFPEAKDKVNIMQAIDNYGEMLGVDPRVVVPTDQAKQTAAARAQAQQDAQQAEQAKTLAQAAQHASQAKLGTGSALDALAAGSGAAPNPAGPSLPSQMPTQQAPPGVM
jgi:hypothetical protein